MQVAVVSDSHVPGRADEIPDRVLNACEDADMTAHAGDFTSEEAYEEFDATGKLVSVRGNMDSVSGLPRTDTFVAGGVEFVVTHGTGAPFGYEDRVAETVRDESREDAVGVCGHTHEVMDTTHGGVRLLNPGSCTGAPPADLATMMLVEAEDGALEVEVVEVDV
ncbi:MAG: metallophosphoesterase family protein [Halobacteriales archaeon]|nr:metallophosphoesterase family protein [Halobacteriales archaeon]